MLKSRLLFPRHKRQHILYQTYFFNSSRRSITSTPSQIRPRPTLSTVSANHVNTKKIKYIDDLSTADYYFEKGLRKVKPYYFDYLAHANDRWIGRPCLQVMNTEFRDRNDAYFREAIDTGMITINGKRVDYDTLFKKGDTLGHRVHRHEPPVTADPIQVIYRDDEWMMINKPGGIQAHPSGRYRHNSVVHILRKQYDLSSLYPINRLDRQTSGLMMIGLNSQKAQHIQQQMQNGNIEKEYLCRVQGEFPKDQVTCDIPIKPMGFKFSFQYADFHNGKPSKTLFERVSFNGRTSVVRCRPITGRTHQIRVHLRYLGYPIVNDPVYGPHTAWSTLLNRFDPADPSGSVVTQVLDKMMEMTTFDTLDTSDGQARCHECRSLLSSDPLPGQSLGIWLHSSRYSGNGWSFSSTTGKDIHGVELKLPSWAMDDFDKDIDVLPTFV
ncbi:uncharacterized protein BX664DRAFT_320948 [Halteromyces radiatus]|uniref:uncharacterized protein n=1 Tax=Halteromyces radiatus TaxID=101107 RepID=UPI00221F3206|nr:uncharacterized protein BX664DRAFT_320948 [Halteromyces radiatus]KAI8099296.1 hypothetical protein BX664DRAFT_320948 [Halteromyces radiatus]